LQYLLVGIVVAQGMMKLVHQSIGL